MRNQTNTYEDNSSTLAPSVPWRLCEVRPLEDYRLYVKFIDGLEGFVDLSKLINSNDAGVFLALRDPQLFNSVYLRYGAVTWPEDLDLAPDAMYDAIKDKGEWAVS